MFSISPIRTLTQLFLDINMLWWNSLPPGVDIVKLWLLNMKNWLIWQKKMISSLVKSMLPSPNKSLKLTKSKVTQPSNSSSMELTSITEDQEQPIKCMDGLKKSQKLFWSKFHNKRLMNWKQNKVLSYILAQIKIREKPLSYLTLLITPLITLSVHPKKINSFFIHWENNPLISQKIFHSQMNKSNNGQCSIQFQLLFPCHQNNTSIGSSMMKLPWKMLLCY